jgi:WD40 repeat protein
MTNDERRATDDGRTQRFDRPPSSVVGHVLLVIDQFEELFTLCRDEFERQAFIDNLVTALSFPEDGLLTLILTIRADFYAHLAQYPELREAVAKHQEFIGPMTSEELRRAIEEPAQRGEWEFEPGLVDLILRDVGDEPGALPLLSHALLETWKRRNGRTLTLAGYHDAGGVRGAIAQTAESVYQQLTPQEQVVARDIFLRLTELGEGTEDTRRRASFDELIPRGETAAGTHAILTRLADARLVTLHQDSAEVAHEALIREWPRLREWLNEDREGLHLHRQITESANEWELLERDSGALLRGARLIQARDFLNNNPYALNNDELAFLQASEAQEAKEIWEKEEQQRRELNAAQKLAETESARAVEQQRSARRLRWFALGLAVFLLAALGAAWLAYNQRNIADANFLAAERIRIASQAQIALDNGEGGDVPALLSLQSLKLGYSPDADASLLNALKRGFTKQSFVGHTNLVWGSSFSPDGRTLLTSSGDSTARLWDLEMGSATVRMTPPMPAITQASFTPDGRYVVFGGPGDTMYSWDPVANQELRQYKGTVAGSWGFDISSDGKFIVTADDDGGKLFDFETGELVLSIPLPYATPAQFSPDDRYIALSSRDNIARIYDRTTGAEVHQFKNDAFVPWISYSPDGECLLTTSGDSAQLWDIETEQLALRLVGHDGDVLYGGFSPNGKFIVTGGADKTARIWDITTGNELYRLTGHTGRILWAEFSPDGRYLTTASEDRTARLWDLQAAREPETIPTFNREVWGDFQTALSPDGEFALYGFDRALNAEGIWNLKSGERTYLPLEDLAHVVGFVAFAFSPDNRFLLGGGEDNSLLMWDAATGKKIHALPGHTGPIVNVNFSPNGKYLLSASEDMTARLWDAQTGNPLQQFTGHQGPVRAAASSPNGDLVLSGSEDNTARLWDANSGKQLFELSGHTAPILAVALSPDGKYALTGSDDQTARLWNVETGKPARQFIGHTDSVSQVAFSPDGSHVLTGSLDQTARLWNTATGEQVREFADHASHVMFAGFGDNGDSVVTADIQAIYRWRTRLDDVIGFTCAELTRDLTTEERELYGIKDTAPTCPKFTR